jgi:hypothetical protein
VNDSQRLDYLEKEAFSVLFSDGSTLKVGGSFRQDIDRAAAPSVVALTITNPGATPTPDRSPRTFGHPFRKGDVPEGYTLVSSVGEIQVDAISRHDDGSMRFAALHAVLPPIIPGGSVRLVLSAVPDESVPLGANFVEPTDLPDLRLAGKNLLRGGTPDGTAWTWSSRGQVTQYGQTATDGLGRVRCEPVGSGRLCSTYRLWGPLVDPAGHPHPHLAVLCFARIWLGSGGEPTSFEFAPILYQGGIEALDATLTPADLQVGDFSLSLGGTPLWASSGLRVPLWSAHLLGGGPMDSAGSVWSTPHSYLHAQFDMDYWAETGLIPPYDFAGMEGVPESDPQPVGYRPGAHPLSFGHLWDCKYNINNTGGSQHIGLLPQWTVKTLKVQSRSWCDSDTAGALYGLGMSPSWTLNPQTGRVPSLLPDSILAPTDNALMGANRPKLFKMGVKYRQQLSADFAVVPITSDNKGGVSPQDFNNQMGGWGATQGMDFSHWPLFNAYLRHGQPWLLELLKVHANHAILSRSDRNASTPGGVIPGRIEWDTQVRTTAWAWRNLGFLLAVLPSDAVERPYFEEVYRQNRMACARIREAQPENFRTLGVWGAPYLLPGGTLGYTVSPFQQHFAYMVQAWLFLMGDDSPQRIGFLEHLLNYLEGTCAPDNLWGSCAYQNLAGLESSGYFKDWSEAPHTNIEGVHTFRPDGWISTDGVSPTGGTALSIAHDAAWDPWPIGTKVMFLKSRVSGRSTPPPAEIVPEAWYKIVETNSQGQVRVAVSAAGPALSFPSLAGRAISGVQASIRRGPIDLGLIRWARPARRSAGPRPSREPTGTA